MRATGFEYGYDAAGNRTSKTVGSGTTWYVRDAQGNTLSVYKVSGANMKLREQNLYGSARLGVFNRNLALSSSLNVTPTTVAGIGRCKNPGFQRLTKISCHSHMEF